MDEYDRLGISDLKELLRSRGLPTTHRRKSELVERLRNSRLASTRSIRNDSTSDDTSVGTNDNDNTNGENSDNDEVFTTNDNDNTNGGNSNNDETFTTNGNDRSNGENSNNEEVFTTNDTEMATISFRDVEDGLEKFSGKPYENAVQWVNEFEKIALSNKWTENQQYVFMRKLLRGAARTDIEGQDLTTYTALKDYILEEYKDEITIVELHSLLQNKRKTAKETCLEYMFEMIKIGRKKMDEKSMVRYIANGINATNSEKMTLYEANTLKELKQKIRIFDCLHATTESQAKPNKNDNRGAKKYDNGKKHDYNKKRCGNCGDNSHTTHDCPNKERGKKCFNCEAFGHISQDCMRPKKTREPKTPQQTPSRSAVMMIKPARKEKMVIPVHVNKTKLNALLDTGSDYTLITRRAFKKAGLGRWTPMRYPLQGFSDEMSYSLGSYEVNVIVNNESYQLQCYVVDDKLMSFEMLLGTDWVDQTIITLTRGDPVIRKADPLIGENETEVHANHIMMIQPSITEVEVKHLPCVTAIQDDRMRAKVTELITNYKCERPQKSSIRMELVLEDNRPVYQHPRRLSAAEREVAKAMIDEFINEGIVRPSNSPYASPILLRKKKNGKYRFCVDYRKLNEKVVKDRFPLPLMEDVLDSLQEYEVFSSIDLRNGFYHVDMDPNSIQYTAFITPDGQYEFLMAPFGLCNSPAIFQRWINMVFKKAREEKLVSLYLDDVTTPAHDEWENLVKLEQVFKIAAENGLIINFEKCQFLQREMEFLGFRVANKTIKPSLAKTEAIRNFPQPMTRKAIQSFLGLTGFFRKFIHNYATIAKPLSDLLRDDQKVVFGTTQLTAFQVLKEKLSTEPVLCLYNPKAVTELHTDASAQGYGGCLLQKQADDGLLHPVYFVSYKTKPAEAKLHSYELEVLAIIVCLERLRSYLLGIPFTIVTDCKAFELTMAKKNATAKVARWALALEEYDMTVKHRPGTAMKHVDALSRNFIMLIDDGILSQIRIAQNNDANCKLISQLLEKGPYGDYTKSNDVIYKFTDGKYLTTIPISMANSLLQRIHGNNHLSKQRMELLVKQDYDIENVGKKIVKLIDNCIPCILASKKKGKQEGYLTSIDKHNVPLHTYHIDHLGPIPSTKKGYTHLLVVVDAFTKFNWLYPVKSTKCEEAITKLQAQQEVFGNPKRIIADKGSAFKADDFDTYCKERNIHLHLVTTATPRGNGQAERMNGIIIPVLIKMAIDEPNKWFKYVGKLQRGINSSISRSTTKTPFELMFGIPMNNEEDLKLNEVIENELINEFNQNRDELRATAKTNISKIQAQNAKQYNKKRKEARLYAIGDLVAIERVQKEKGQKVHTKMVGPYEITKVKRNHRYEVKKIGFGEGPINTSAPADRIKPWTADDDTDDDN